MLEHIWHIAFGLSASDGWGGERGAGYPWSDRCDFFACGPLCPDPEAAVEGDEADGYAFSYLDVKINSRGGLGSMVFTGRGVALD